MCVFGGDLVCVYVCGSSKLNLEMVLVIRYGFDRCRVGNGKIKIVFVLFFDNGRNMTFYV